MKYYTQDYINALMQMQPHSEGGNPVFRTRLRVTHALYVCPFSANRKKLSIEVLFDLMHNHYSIRAASESLQRVGIQP